MSKGSWRRPTLVPKEQVDANWERAFGKKKTTDVKKKEEKGQQGKQDKTK